MSPRREREEAIRTAPAVLRIVPLVYWLIPVVLVLGVVLHDWVHAFVLFGLGLPLAYAPWDRVLVWSRRRRRSRR